MEKIRERRVFITDTYIHIQNEFGGGVGAHVDDDMLRLIATAIKAHFEEEEQEEAQTVPATGCPECESKYYAGMPGMCQCREEAENG